MAVPSIAESRGWDLLGVQAIGGLTEIGISYDETHVLVVSHAGRGLIEVSTLDCVARDNDVTTTDSDWLDDEQHLVKGIGPYAAEWFRTVGLWGGELAPVCAQGWRVRIQRDGCDELCLIEGSEKRETILVDRSITEVRAFGFSVSGRYLLLATSSDLTIYAAAA